LTGVLIAAVVAFSVSVGGSETPLSIVSENFSSSIVPELLGLAVFSGIIIYFCKIVLNFKKN